MAYYDALKTQWATLSAGDTTAQKLAAINALTVAGPNIDVQPSAVKGKLLLMGAYFPLKAFAGGALTGNTTHDNALGAAMSLIEMLDMPNAPLFAMSDAQTYATIKTMADAVLAQETAAPGTTGFTQAVHDALLTLASTTRPWWQSNGYAGPITMGDLAMASLEGLTPWARGPYDVRGPTADGNTQVFADFWDTAAPTVTIRFGPFTSASADQAAVDNWAAQVMRTQANRAALAKQIV